MEIYCISFISEVVATGYYLAGLKKCL